MSRVHRNWQDAPGSSQHFPQPPLHLTKKRHCLSTQGVGGAGGSWAEDRRFLNLARMCPDSCCLGGGGGVKFMTLAQAGNLPRLKPYFVINCDKRD